MIMSLLYSCEFLSILDHLCVIRAQVQHQLTDMFNSSATFDLGAKVSPYRSLKHFHHEVEQRTREGRIPSTFGTLVTDKGVLCLYL